MKAFDYLRAESVSAASTQVADPETRLLAGGTTLIDLMKLNVVNTGLLFRKSAGVNFPTL